MPSQRGRDLLLKIESSLLSGTFIDIGSARVMAVSITNGAVDGTTMGSDGIQFSRVDAGVQDMDITLDGLFKDTSSEEVLRAAAFARSQNNYKISFPNGDAYSAPFVVREYRRAGAHDNLETFTVTLTRSGSGTFVAGG